MSNPLASGADAPEALTVETYTIYDPQLDQPKIDRLVQAMVDGITPPRPMFMTTWQGTRLRVPSLPQLRRAVALCHQPGDTRRLETLELRAGTGDRRVSVAIGAKAAMITVEGVDAAWAIGRAEQIRRILRHARGSDRPRTWGALRFALAAVASALAMCGVALHLGLLAADPRSAITAIAIMIAATAGGYLVGRRRAARNQTVIWIDGTLPRSGWGSWSRTERIALLVGVLGILASLLA